MLALFEIVFFPTAIMNITFRITSGLYSLVLLVFTGSILWSLRKKNWCKWFKKQSSPKLNRTEIFFASFFILLLIVQLYFALFYSRTYMADDGYVEYSTSALANNYLFLTNSYTGIYQIHNYIWLSRVIQTFNFFPAYLSLLSHVHPTIIAHTVLYIVVVLLAYGTYFVMSHKLFKENENRFMFLCFVAMLFIFGYHSHYSLTFRLLGPNNEGKAVLAVVLAPFMLVLMQDILESSYSIEYGIQLLILSIAACSLTMGGIYTMAAMLNATVLFSTIKNKSGHYIWYLFWGGSIPCFFSILYLGLRFGAI